jgi:hypothetical protein
MAIGEIHILPTDNTPEYIFSSEGILKIRGRGLYNNNIEITSMLSEWVIEYLKNPPEVTYVILAFEYLNSLSTIMLVSLLRKLSEVTMEAKKLIIHWYYEDDDEDMFERGEYISVTFNIPFTFIPTSISPEL